MPKRRRSPIPTLAPDGHRGGSYRDRRRVDPPRNVRAYSLAMQAAGVELRERTAFLGIRTAARGGRRRVIGVQTPDGAIATGRVLLTGGPSCAAVGKLVGAADPGGRRPPQVAVTEPHGAFDVDRQPMVFDMGAGLYWRLEEGGLLFGRSNPDERPGPAREIDWPYSARCERGSRRLVPMTPGPRPTQGVGGDDRLHAGPPADPGAGHRPRTVADRRRHGRRRRRPRDDVGAGRRARRGRPRRSRGGPT